MSHTIKGLQPYKTIDLNQFKFMQDVMSSHEYAELTTRLLPAHLQDRLDWMWNLHQQGKVTRNEAIEGVYNTINHPQQFISDQIGLRIDTGDTALQLEVGSKCIYMYNGVPQNIEVTDLKIDFGCANGGLYPINVTFKINGNIVDEWFDCFGRSINGEQLLTEIPQKQLSSDDLEEAHQYFIENLYANFRWANYADREMSATARIKFAKKLWEQFQADFNLIQYPLTQGGYGPLVTTFVEKNLNHYA